MKKGWKILIYVFLGLFLIGLLMPNEPTVTKAIEQDSKLQYATSITSKADQSDRANVYTIAMSVPEAAKYLMEKKRPESYTDLKNEETIQLVYDDNYVLIYKGEDTKTYVQTSSRKYVHQNGYNGLYRPFNPGLILLANRNYSYGGYSNNDSQRYGKGLQQNDAVPASGTKIRTDQDNSSKIKTDSSSANKIRTSSSSGQSGSSSYGTSSSSGSVRSGSTTSRASIGGGTSFGK